MILGTRGSALARRQTDWVRLRLLEMHPDLGVEVRIIRTTGDRQSEASRSGTVDVRGLGKGVFVKEIEEALLGSDIDAAVHSMKDLPTELPAGLTIAAVPVREDPFDALVTLTGSDLDGLEPGARVGTGSPRRAALIAAHRRDLEIVPIQGNVDTRIRRLREGAVEALVLAAAGLARLGFSSGNEGVYAVAIPESVCLPAIGQGALAIQTRLSDGETRRLVAVLNDPVTSASASAERAFLAGLGGGCRTPVAAYARLGRDGRMLTMEGVVCSTDGSRSVRVRGDAPLERAEAMGRRLAEDARGRGAGEILAED